MEDVAKKRSSKPQLVAFGRWLAERRGKRTRQAISNRLSALGAPLGGATLAQYESGTVWSPDPTVLWGLAQIYKVQHSEVIALLLLNRRYPTSESWIDLLRHSEDQQSSFQEGGSPDDGASAGDSDPVQEVIALKQQVETLTAALGAIQDVVNGLIELDALREQGRGVGASAPGRRGRS